MKTLWSVLPVLAGLLISPFAPLAAESLVVVFNGNTEINRHTYNFIRQELGRAGANYEVLGTLDPTQVKPKTYKAVIVVSTGVSRGVDPVLAKWMTTYPAPKEIYLVTLLARSAATGVTPFTAATGGLGVDGVSAASVWGRRALVDPIALHRSWVLELADYLAAKK